MPIQGSECTYAAARRIGANSAAAGTFKLPLGSCTVAALVCHFVLRAPLLALVMWLAFLCSKATALFETTAWSVVTRAWEFAFDWWMVPLLAVAWRVRAVVRAKKKT